MSEKAYCPRCRDEVTFDTVEIVDSTELDGKTYSYPTKKAICPICGSEAVFQPYEEAAALSFNDAVRAQEGLVALSTIRDLPKRYNIGKRPLSKLLGWGEITYSRFIEGQTPSKRYSYAIEELSSDPLAYKELLLKEQDKISKVTFSKSLKAVDAIIDGEYPETARLFEVADCFCILAAGDITTMMIQKLMYYAQGFSLVFLDHPLFAQTPRAWVWGPVYGQVWHEYSNRNLTEEYENSSETLFHSASPFSEDEEDLIRAVYSSYGQFSGPVLSRMTHAESPWILARSRAGAKASERCNEQIKLEEMRDFFVRMKDKYHMNCLADIDLYAEDTSRSIQI